MSNARYYVSRGGHGWTVHFDGVDYTYRTQYDAMIAAIEAAYEAGKAGHEGQVLVANRDGTWLAEWTYRVDPYPPTGYPHR